MRKANNSSGSTNGSRYERVISGLGVMYGQPIGHLVQGRSRHHQSTAPAAVAASSSQQSEKKRKAEMTCPSPARGHPVAKSWSSSSSSSSSFHRPAASSEPAGNKSSSSSRESISQSNDKVPHRRGPAGMAAEQYNLATGRKIARFDSQNDAERATGIGHAFISKCVSGKYTHADGFGWRRPGTTGGGAASGKITTSSTAATMAARNSISDTRPRTTSKGVISSRFQRSGPYNVSLSKGTIISTQL